MKTSACQWVINHYGVILVVLIGLPWSTLQMAEASCGQFGHRVSRQTQLRLLTDVGGGEQEEDILYGEIFVEEMLKKNGCKQCR